MVWWGRRSDRLVERRFHAAFPLFVAAVGIAASTALDDPTLKMLALCVAGFGIFACLPVFWTLPTAFLSGAAAAAGIAVINSIGNLAGFAGPFAMGWIKDTTGSYAGGLLLLAGLGVLAMGIVLMLGHDDTLERAPVPRKVLRSSEPSSPWSCARRDRRAPLPLLSVDRSGELRS